MMRKTLQSLVGNHDERDFAKLFNTHADAIYRFVYWRVGDEELARDTTSEVFMKAWEKWDSFDKAYPKAWLFTIARNKVIDTYRKRTDEQLEEDEELVSDESIEENIEKKLNSERLRSVLLRMKKKDRTVLELRFMSGLSARETAHIMGTTDANVRVLQYRALNELRRLYELV